jgi:hypothetical protein
VVLERKRYYVTIVGNGRTEQTVIIAYDTESMFYLARKLYGHLLLDHDGNKTGNISFQETALTNKVARSKSKPINFNSTCSNTPQFNKGQYPTKGFYDI